MNVLIKGMEMPKKSGVYCLDLYVGETCRVQRIDGMTYEIAEVCTPHGRLIDADALLSLLDKCMFPSDMVTTSAVRMATNWIKEAPTVIEAEGYSERELQRDYEASVEYAQHCGEYEPTYDPDTGAM